MLIPSGSPPLNMVKFFLATLFIIFLVAAGWYYLPVTLRDKVAAFIGIAASRDTGEIKTLVEDVILPSDPQERRAVLIGELKKNIALLKQKSPTGVLRQAAKKPTDGKVNEAASIEEIVGASEKILDELEVANGDASVREKITERIFDTIFSPKSAPVDCRPAGK